MKGVCITMVFCTNCGHKNSENQKFCVNCGAPLRNANASQQTSQDKEQTQSQHHDSQHASAQQQHNQGSQQDRARQTTQSSASQSHGAHQQTRQTSHTYRQEPDKRGGSKVWIVISTIIFLAILAALIFGAYKLYDHYTNKSNDHKQSQHASKKDSSKSKSSDSDDSSSDKDKKDDPADNPTDPDAAKVDVFSDEFDHNYMKAASKQGYNGINNGMTREQVEKKLGHPEGEVDGRDHVFKQYHDLAVYYNDDDEVEQVAIAPHNVSKSDYIDKYYDPDDHEGDDLVYDSDTTNNFSIVVTIDGGSVKTIENIDQLDR